MLALGEEGFADAGVEFGGGDRFIEDVDGLLVEFGGGESGGVLCFEGGIGGAVFFDYLAEEVSGPERIPEGAVVGDEKEVGEFGLGDGVVLFGRGGRIGSSRRRGRPCGGRREFQRFSTKGSGRLGSSLMAVARASRRAHLFLVVQRLAEEKVRCRGMSPVLSSMAARRNCCSASARAAGLEKGGAGGGEEFGIAGQRR